MFAAGGDGCYFIYFILFIFFFTLLRLLFAPSLRRDGSNCSGTDKEDIW